MGYAIGLFLLVVGTICKRYFLPFIIVTFVLALGGGAVAAATGGSFWPACQIVAEACAGIAVLAAIVTTLCAISNGFK